MNARIPQELSLAAYKRLDDAADALEAENKRMAAQNATKWLGDAEFWTEELLDSDLKIADDMADAMKHLEAAAMEAAALDLSQCYFIRKVLGALCGVEKSAKGRAEVQLLDIYQRGE